MQTYEIDDLPELKKHLSKADADRIRYHQKATGKRQPAATNIKNPVLEEMQALRENGQSTEVWEILIGAVRTDQSGDRRLSAERLGVMLQTLPIINSREVGLGMYIGPRQAQRYVRVAKFAIPLLVRHFAKKHARKKAKGKQR